MGWQECGTAQGLLPPTDLSDPADFSGPPETWHDVCSLLPLTWNTHWCSQPSTVSSNPQWFCSTKSILLSRQGLVLPVLLPTKCKLFLSSCQWHSNHVDVSWWLEHLYVHYKIPYNTPDTLPQNTRVGCAPEQSLSCSTYIRSLSFSFFRPSHKLGTEYNKDHFNVTERARYGAYTQNSAWTCCNAEPTLTTHTTESLSGYTPG